jgi:hypothetical protein
LNPLDKVTSTDFEASLQALEQQNLVTVTLNAGQEYAAFNPDPITYLLNGMGITTDPKYATKTFAGVVGGNYVLNFRYWSYESDPITDFESIIIDYFATDKARLIAPIKSV